MTPSQTARYVGDTAVYEAVTSDGPWLQWAIDMRTGEYASVTMLPVCDD